MLKKFLITLIVLALPPTVIFLVMSQPEQPPHPPSKNFSADRLSPIIGVYEMAGHEQVLATYSARGGVVLFGLNGTRFSRADYLSSSITPTVLPDVYEWEPFSKDNVARVLTLVREQGVVTGFTWEGGNANRVEAGFSQQEVHWLNGEIELTGTVFVPNKITNGGAVVIHGSGWSDRDNLWYLHFVMKLVDSGVAVLFPDKRGSGESGGDWRSSSFDEFALDSLVGREKLSEITGIRTENIGLLGISQGGSVAPRAAAISGDVPWIVNVSGSSVSFEESLVHETYQNLRQMGIPSMFDTFMHPYAFAIAQRKRSNWWALNGGYDPLEDWQLLEVPTLVLYGREDEWDNVPVQTSIERFESLQAKNIEINVYGGLGHGLFDETTRNIRPEVLDRVAGWANRHGNGHPQNKSS